MLIVDGKSLRVREVIRLIEIDGCFWLEAEGVIDNIPASIQERSCYVLWQFDKDIMPKTLKSILKQAGLEDKND